MKQIRVGIFGLGRGGAFVNSVLENNGKIVAFCEKREEQLYGLKEMYGEDTGVYTDFDEFIEHPGMDLVIITNYFNEHTACAIKALERNINVLCECLSNATMAEGVALVRAAEKSKAFFMLSENYPYMKFNQEMYRVYRGGSLGKVLYAEGEYNHPIITDDPVKETMGGHRGFEKHWRNYTPRTYYITHSLAPLMYITGSTPVRVTAMPVYHPGGDDMFGPAVKDRAAIVTTLNDDDSVFRVTGCAGFGAHDNSYRICGTLGQIENVRGMGEKVMLRYDDSHVPEGMEENNLYDPEWHHEEKELIEKAGHGGGDFLIIKECLNCIRENRHPVFDEYFSTTMSSVAILGHRSLLERGVPYDIPDFRREEDRVKYENDHDTPFYDSFGGEPTIPCSSR